MKEESMNSVLEVFVCNKESCAEKGSKELTDKLKKWSKEEHHKVIKVYRCGCLGKCDEGIAVAIYPHKKILTEVREEDLKELKKGLEEALGNHALIKE